MTDIPTPEESGSDGTQKPATQELATPESPFGGLPITRVMEGLAASKSRSMGGEVAAGLIAGSFTQISHELQETKQDLRDTRSALDKAREDLSICKSRAAVLEERVESNLRGRHLRNLGIAVGTTMVGVGIELLKNDFNKYAYITFGLGVLLVLLGWFSIDNRGKI